jgi:hypothetical protein
MEAENTVCSCVKHLMGRALAGLSFGVVSSAICAVHTVLDFFVPVARKRAFYTLCAVKFGIDSWTIHTFSLH